MRRRVAVLSVCAVVASCVVITLFQPTFGNQDSGPANPGEAKIDFSDKIVVLRVNQPSLLEQKSQTRYIKNAVVKKMGGRFFIVGVLPDRHPNSENERWALLAGVEVGVPWDAVAGYFACTPKEFEDIVSHEVERAN